MEQQNGDVMKNLNILASVLAMVLATACYGGRVLAERVDAESGDEPTLNTEAVGPTGPRLIDAGLVTSNEQEQALVDRWNAVPLATQSIAAHGQTFDFLWPTFGEFPHPTFKGGTEEGYRMFARVLLAFMRTGDNFDFLANGKTEYQGYTWNIFDLLIGEATESGKVEVGWTFRKLVEWFATDSEGIYSWVDPDTRSGLAEVAKRIPES
jgi:hypothetical protein